jgi:hypothetical protein
VLFRSLEEVDKMNDCVVIYRSHDEGKLGSFYSDLSVEKALYLVRMFEHWLLNHALGVQE